MKQPFRPYYTEEDRACDHIMRCKDCKKLVVLQYLRHAGSCYCGNRRFEEIRTLSVWEWLKIRLGFIRFHSRVQFLREFSLGK